MGGLWFVGAEQATALVINPATSLSARLLVRVADPTDPGIAVEPVVRTNL
jgi:hypothetical protein